MLPHRFGVIGGRLEVEITVGKCDYNPDFTTIRYAFRRSPARIQILKVLAEKRTTYCGEICRLTGLSRRTVMGTLRGNAHYAKNLSFVYLNLVKESKIEGDDRIKKYSISERGANLFDDISRENRR